jgi:hypothetical protein
MFQITVHTHDFDLYADLAVCNATAFRPVTLERDARSSRRMRKMYRSRPIVAEDAMILLSRFPLPTCTAHERNPLEFAMTLKPQLT